MLDWNDLKSFVALARASASRWCRPTASGEAMREPAEPVAQAVQGVKQPVHAQRDDAVGVVRATCTEPVVPRLKESTLIERLRALHGRLRVEFVMSHRCLEVMKGDADIALRSGDADDGELAGRKFGDSCWGVFASRACIERHGQPAERGRAGPARADRGFDDGAGAPPRRAMARTRRRVLRLRRRRGRGAAADPHRLSV